MSPLAKKLAWALGLSLALNLFFLGFGVARRLNPPAPRAQAPGEMMPFDSARAARLFGQHSPELRAHRKEVQRARKAVVEALLAEPFDKEALAQAFEKLRDATHNGQKELHDALVEAAANISHEERAVLARSPLLHDVPAGGKRPGFGAPRGH